MADVQIATQISEIRRLMWQQNWPEAYKKCQEVVDDPRADEEARKETQSLLNSIETKARAETTIRQALSDVDTELKKPNPDYAALKTRLKHAIELGNVHIIQRWHSQLYARLDDVSRRRDVHARYEADRKRFKETLGSGDHEKALEIANRLLEDAELNQQPSLAESAREWLKQIGDKVKLDQIANSIDSALRRQDFAWACQLFDKLPATYPRYSQLAPYIDDARTNLEAIEKDLQDARGFLERAKFHDVEVILTGLQRKYRNNRMWRPFWLEFYSEQARKANMEGDSFAAQGRFLEAKGAYREASKKYNLLYDVFGEEPSLKQMADTAGVCEATCASLEDAANARERGDAQVAHAACSKAIGGLDRAAASIKDATRVLRQRAAELLNSLQSLQQAIDDLTTVKAYAADGDIAQRLDLLDHVLTLAPDLPEAVRREANDLKISTSKVLDQVSALLQEAHQNEISSPEQAADAYLQAWQLSHSLDLQKDMVRFFLEAADRQPAGERETWLRRALQIDPANEHANAKLLVLSKRPELDEKLNPIRTRLDQLYSAADPSLSEVAAVSREIAVLAGQVDQVPDLLAILEPEQNRCTRLEQVLRQTQTALHEAEQKKQAGGWQEAMDLLNKAAADQNQLDSQRAKLRAEADVLQGAFDHAGRSYQAARGLYSEAMKAYQATTTTHDYETVALLVLQCRDKLQLAQSQLNAPLPREWAQFQQDLQVFERRAKDMLDTWEASLDPQQPLAELVLGLRQSQSADQPDPVLANLLDALARRAVDECLSRAKDNEDNGRDENAQRELETALKLGGERPDLRAKLDTLRQRADRTKRIKELRKEIQTLHERSGGLLMASPLQTEVLQLVAEDSGQPAWITVVQQIIQSLSKDVENSFQRIAQDAESSDGGEATTQLVEARKTYTEHLREAEQSIERLRELTREAGSKGAKVREEAEVWLRLKQQLVHYNMATSAGALGNFVLQAKEYERLNKEIVDKGVVGEYDYRQELAEARDAVLKLVLSSATKRRRDAEASLKEGFYDQAVKDLEEIETGFYVLVEREIPSLNARLNLIENNEQGLGDVRIEARNKLSEAKRLQKIAKDLDEKEKEVRLDWHKDPAARLIQMDEIKLFDPKRECKQVWERLDLLAEQMRTEQREQAAEKARKAIRAAEIALETARTDENYQKIKQDLQDVNPDILSNEYQGRHKRVLETINEQAGLPALIEIAHRELQQGHYSEARKHYEEALKIRPKQDAEFTRRLNEARSHALIHDQVNELVGQATGCMHDKPEEAIKFLEQARNKAEQQELTVQVRNIERLIARANARLAINAAWQALKDMDSDKAGKQAELALTYANQANDESIKTEATHIQDGLKKQEELEETIGKVVSQARGLIRDRKWKQALDALQALPARALESSRVKPTLAEAEKGDLEAKRVEQEIKGLIEAGQFDAAFDQLNKAKMSLKVSDDDGQRLHQEIQVVEEQMAKWKREIERLLRDLAAADVVTVRSIQDAIQRVSGLATDKQAVKGLRDSAAQLAHSLDDLKQRLERVSKVVANAQMKVKTDGVSALNMLSEFPDTLRVEYQSQSYDIRYDLAANVHALRREAIASQFADLSAKSELSTDWQADALNNLLKKCEDFRRHLTSPDEVARLVNLQAKIELALAQKQTDKLCQDWQARLDEAASLRASGEDDAALIIAQTTQKEIDEQRKISPTETWAPMTEIWQKASKLGKEIVREREVGLEQRVAKLEDKAKNARDEGNLDKIDDCLHDCDELLTEKRLTERLKNRLESLAADLKTTQATYKQTLEIWKRAKEAVRSRKYTQTVQMLSEAPAWPQSLQAQHEALSKVVADICSADNALANAAEAVTSDALSARIGPVREALQRCKSIRDPWPAALSESEGWVRDLRNEIGPLTQRLRGKLFEMTDQMVNFALSASNPDEAERLIIVACDQGWVTDDQSERMKDLDHEVTVVRAALAVDSALTNRSDVAAVKGQLEMLLKEPRVIHSQRNQRARAILTLAEVHQLLEQGKTRQAEQWLASDPALTEMPSYSVVSREVNEAIRSLKLQEGLARQVDSLTLKPQGADFGDMSAWLMDLKRLDKEGQPLMKAKLQELLKRIRQELDVAREGGDYARLIALNPLAQELDLGEPDPVGLRKQQKDRLRAEIEQAREALNVYAPDIAELHIRMAERLAEQEGSEVSQLKKQLEECRTATREVDRLISDAEVAIARNDYDLAARAYDQAAHKAPKRSTVTSFEKSQHEILWEAFQDALGKQLFPHALEIAERAGRFGFKAEDWQIAMRDAQDQRDKQIAQLVRQVEAALSGPDPDLEKARDDLKNALVWQPDSTDLDRLLREVETRLKTAGEARTDVRHGWLSLDQSDYVSASQYFGSAKKRLSHEHPEILRWLRFAELVNDAKQHLAQMEQRQLREIDIEPLPAGGFKVVAPGWEEAERLLTDAAAVLAQPVRSILLGVEGENNQALHRQRVAGWQLLTQSISQRLADIQKCYDEKPERFDEARLRYDQARQDLKALRQALRAGEVWPLSAAETEVPLASFVAPISVSTEPDAALAPTHMSDQTPISPLASDLVAVTQVEYTPSHTAPTESDGPEPETTRESELLLRTIESGPSLQAAEQAGVIAVVSLPVNPPSVPDTSPDLQERKDAPPEPETIVPVQLSKEELENLF